MPDGVFYFLAYGAPSVLSVILGGSLFRRVRRSPRRILGRAWIALWCAVSLFTVAAGVVAGRLYTYVSLRYPPDPALPLRPGLIMLAFMSVQGVVGWVFLRTLREERAGGPTTR